MKKTFIFLSVLLISFANVSVAQSLEEVLDKHYKAVGQEKLASIESFYIKAKLSQMGMDLPMEMKIKKPEKFIISVDFQGQKMVQAYDGEKGWMIIPMMSPDPQELKGDDLQQVKQQVNLEGELYKYKAKGSSADLSGKVNIDGKDYFRIKLTTKDQSVKNYFIDPETYLVARVKSKVTVKGQTVDVEQVMSDYIAIDGITMAKKIETISPMASTILMEEIKFNEKFDDSIFKQPTN